MAFPIEIFRKTDAAFHIARELEKLSEPVERGAVAVEPSQDEAAALRVWLPREGYVALPSAAAPALSADLARRVEGIVASGIPGVFAYATPDIWELGFELAERLSRATGTTYELLEDAWAWSITPGTGRGWKPHRGGGPHLFDRRAPELVSVWVALADVTAEQACLHVVPFDDDPGYPDALERTDAPLGAVRALPVAAGTALAWNANLLHWGGSCSARARGPRVSCSFSLGRADARAVHGVRPLARGSARLASVAQRLEIVAEQIALYGRGAARHEVPDAVLEWALASRALGGDLTALLSQRADRKEG